MDLDCPATNYLGGKFDNLAMAYHITKDNLWRKFTRCFRCNDIQLWHVLCCIEGKYESLYMHTIKLTYMPQIPVTFHSRMLLSGHLNGHKLLSQKAFYYLGTTTVVGYTLIRIAYLYHTKFCSSLNTYQWTYLACLSPPFFSASKLLQCHGRYTLVCTCLM